MNPPKLVSLALFTLALAQLTGCAMAKKSASSASTAGSPSTVVAKNAPAPVSDAVQINSTPPGAVVSINGNDIGPTPVTANLDRAQTYLVAIKQPGFYYYTLTLKAEAKSSGAQTDKAGLMSSSPARFPADLSLTLVPVKDRFQALVVAVSKLDDQLKTHQISQDAYKQQLTEVTGLYR